MNKMTASLDALDQSILKVLQKDARLSYRQIATEVGVSAVTVLNRVKKLEKSNIIRDYTIKLDFEKYGYDVEVAIDIATAMGKLPELKKKLASFPNVHAVYQITGDFDVLVVSRFKDKDEASEFLQKLQKLESIDHLKSRIIMKTIK